MRSLEQIPWRYHFLLDLGILWSTRNLLILFSVSQHCLMISSTGEESSGGVILTMLSHSSGPEWDVTRVQALLQPRPEAWRPGQRVVSSHSTGGSPLEAMSWHSRSWSHGHHCSPLSHVTFTSLTLTPGSETRRHSSQDKQEESSTALSSSILLIIIMTPSTISSVSQAN